MSRHNLPIDAQEVLAEAEAVRILYRREQGLPDGEQVEVPEQDFYRLLAKVQENKARIEAAALKTLRLATSENRKTPRRHMRFALGLLFAIGLLLMVVLGISELLARL